ncbi:MAG: 1-deoxy-D-xylulose-5-phosphate reductoisomerase [Spirochaetales bacterium]|nr:1-deoxy-D-xylulose-5-phosphate reductoisomerase [Spirochaetales bacterium]
MSNLVLLGCTGSIGRSTLSVVRAHADRFKITAASAHRNESELLRTADQFGIETLALSGAAPEDPRIAFSGESGLLDMIRESDADTVVNGIAGAAGLMPSVAALESGKHLALANKETLVIAGGLIKKLAEEHGKKILPVDSEHAALFSLLGRSDADSVESLILTASGGAFRELPLERLRDVTWRDALAHPTWNMGRKITIDSASMANKGLEIIEACELFGVPESKIEVVIHPQSCIHGMIRTSDGSVYAQMSLPDMRIPIQNALSYPAIIEYPFDRIDFGNLNLNLSKPDGERYPCLALARAAARKGGVYPLVFNAANEVAVEAFIRGEIHFTDIPSVIGSCLEEEWECLLGSLEQIQEYDQKARETASASIREMKN